MQLKKRKYKSTTCESCGLVRTVSFYSNPKMCQKCSNSKGSRASKPSRVTGQHKNCLLCFGTFWSFKSDKRKFCSAACGNKSKRRYEKETRECRFCKSSFVFSSKPFSNSPGNYCSIKCRNDGYASGAVSYGHKGLRPRWRSIRDKFIKKNDFCNQCGTQEKKLQVHHINPYRSSKYDGLENLITLCVPCHSKHEKFSKIIEKLPEANKPIAVALVQAYMSDLWHRYKGEQLLEN